MVTQAAAQGAASAAAPSPAAAAAHPARPAATPRAAKGTHALRSALPDSARTYYTRMWGVDKLRARRTSSGELVRFSYRVVDPALAQVLQDNKATPYMIHERTRAMLQVPSLENVGELRQAHPAEAGREYWMVFSNKGNYVRVGDRVDLLIGAFHVEGLVVE